MHSPLKKSSAGLFCLAWIWLLAFAGVAQAATLLSSNFNNGTQGWLVGTRPHEWRLNSDTNGGGAYNGMNNTWCLSNVFAYENNFAGSPALTLVAGQKYVLSFQIKLQALTVTRNFQVFLNTTRAQDGNEKAIFTKLYGDGAGTTWTNLTVEFTAEVSGTHYLLFDAFQGNYRAIYLDDVVVEDAVPPTITLTSPAAGTSVQEFQSVNLTSNAADSDGSVQKVEYFADGELIATATSAPFSATWAGMLPGQYQITAKAWDNRNLSTVSAAATFTVNFTDGTLTEYRNWTFDSDASSWTFSGGWGGGYGLLSSSSVDSADFAASPAQYLFAGVTYKYEFFDDADGNGRQVTVAYNTSASIFGGKTDLATFTFNTTDDYAIKRTGTFTVPVSGRYYMVLYVTSQNAGTLGSNISNFRLIGDMNSAPEIAIPGPIITNTVVNSFVKLAPVVSDSDGTIAAVDFIANGSTFDTDTTAPYETTWRPSTEGTIAVSAVARDNNAGLGYSEVLNFNVKGNAFSAASLLGGSADTDGARGIAIQPDGTLVVVANIGNATPGGLTPILLNGATAASGGAVLRLSADGRTVLSVTRLANQVSDLDLDDAGNIHVAVMAQGALKLNPSASTVLWSRVPANYTHRLDAGPNGTVAVLTTSATTLDAQIKPSGATVIYNAAGTQIGATLGGSANSHDVSIDETSQTVIVVGHRNYNTWDGTQSYPVDVPGIKGYAYDGTIKYVAYDWESDTASPRYLNKYDNNMADTRAVRCSIGLDGKFYVAFTTAGGNHPLRYSPFDLAQPVVNVGGDFYSTLSNTNTEIHLFVGRYEPATCAYLLGQNLTGRLPNGAGNTITAHNGDICADALGRVYVTGASAYGFPFTLDHFPGGYSGGAFLLMLSPDFSTREIGLHLSETGGGHAVAIRGNTVAFAGDCVRQSTSAVSFYPVNPIQPTMGGNQDGFFAVGDLSPYTQFQSGEHPRLFFSQSDIAALRAKSGTAPFSNMITAMINQRLMADYPYQGPYQVTNDEDVGQRAKLAAFLWTVTGDETYALEARQLVDLLINWNSGADWANPAVKGLTLDWRGMVAAFVYDLCANSNTWDDGYNYYVSKKIRQQADVVADNGGSEQNTDAASNWQGIRGSAAGIMYLATDHEYDAVKLNNSHGRFMNHLNANLGAGPASRGWVLEGLGYTYYPFGNYYGPYVEAMRRHDPSRDASGHTGFQWAYWTALSTAVSAVDANQFGGVHPDFSDDNPHLLSDGMFGQAFLFAPKSVKGGIKDVYDRITGPQSPFGARWDAPRAGTIWSYLYYPTATASVNPMTLPDWLKAFDDSATSGFMTYRNRYLNGSDTVAQFRAKTRNTVGSHDAPDALGVRIISHGVPFIVGGGRNNPGARTLQSGLYPSDPRTGTYATNRNTAAIVGTPAVLLNGGGHAVAEMATNNTGATAHKRWFLANFDSAQTGADASFLIGDQSTNGQFFQLATLSSNTVTFSGNTFLITGPNGATMKGTVLYPTSNYRFETGVSARGSDYGGENDNRYIEIQSDDGDYLIALTVVQSGAAHPAVSSTGATVAASSVTVGTKAFGFASTGVSYTTPTGVLAGTDTAATGISQSVVIDVLANDLRQGGTSLTLSSVTQPAHGTVVIASGKCTYTPTAGYQGADSFTYTVANGTATSTATVNITVSNLNAAPVAQSDLVTATTGIATSIPVLLNDTDDGLPTPPGALSLASFTQPAHGTVTQTGALLAYTSVAGYSGADSFTYTITDGALTSTATVSVTVTDVPTPKVVALNFGGSSPLDDRPNNGYYWNALAGTSPSLSALKDVDSQATDIGVTTTNPFGWVTGRGRNMQIISGGHQYPASVSGIFAADNRATSTPPRDGFVVIRISSVVEYVYDLSMLASNDYLNHADGVDLVRFNVGGTYNSATRNFTGGKTVLLDSAKGAENWETGLLDLVEPTWDENSGKWIVDFQICYAHPTASSNVAPLNALVITANIPQPDNLPPDAVADTVSALSGIASTIDVVANDTDDGYPAVPGTLSIAEFTQPAHGTVTESNNQLIYTSVAGYTGADSFTYTITDGALADTATVTLSVSVPNNPPVAVADSASVMSGGVATIPVLANDTDDGQPASPGVLFISAFTQPAHGSVTQSGAQLLYTPAAAYVGADTFTYTVSDGGLSATANVTVDVTALPPAKVVAINIGGGAVIDDRANGGYYWNTAVGTSPTNSSLKDSASAATDIAISTTNPFAWSIGRGRNMAITTGGHTYPAGASLMFAADNYASGTPARDGRAVVRISSDTQYVYTISVLASNDYGNRADGLDLVRYNVGGTYNSATRDFTGGTSILLDAAKGATNWDAGALADVASTWDAGSGKWIVDLQMCYASLGSTGNVAPLNALVLVANVAPPAPPAQQSGFTTMSMAGPSATGDEATQSQTQAAAVENAVPTETLLDIDLDGFAGTEPYFQFTFDDLPMTAVELESLVEVQWNDDFTDNWNSIDSIPGAVWFVMDENTQPPTSTVWLYVPYSFGPDGAFDVRLKLPAP